MIRGRELAEYMRHYKLGGTPQVTALNFFLCTPAQPDTKPAAEPEPGNTGEDCPECMGECTRTH